MNPIEFLRQFRIGGYAIFDFSLAFLGMYLVAPLLSKIFHKIRLDIPKRNWLFFTLLISILAHLLVGKMTPMTKAFLDINGHYLLQLVVLGFFALGLIGIKVIKKNSLPKKI